MNEILWIILNKYLKGWFISISLSVISKVELLTWFKFANAFTEILYFWCLHNSGLSLHHYTSSIVSFQSSAGSFILRGRGLNHTLENQFFPHISKLRVSP